MSKQIKKVTFVSNNYGMGWLSVDTRGWTIVDACGIGRNLVGRACRFTPRGNRVEYREGSTYIAINADIERMG